MQTQSSTTSQPHKNEVHLAGTLVRDPILKYTATGKQVASLMIVTRFGKFSESHRIVCWEKLAEKVAELKQGAFLRIVGRLQTHSWEDKQSGQRKYAIEIVAFQIVIPGDEPAPLTPDATKGGVATARAILRPAQERRGDDAF